jgi:hypothetical protein
MHACVIICCEVEQKDAVREFACNLGSYVSMVGYYVQKKALQGHMRVISNIIRCFIKEEVI